MGAQEVGIAFNFDVFDAAWRAALPSAKSAACHDEPMEEFIRPRAPHQAYLNNLSNWAWAGPSRRPARPAAFKVAI